MIQIGKNNLKRIQLFKEFYEQSVHNLLCYSQDIYMKKPKEKYVDDWEKERQKVNLLKELIAEEKQKEIINNSVENKQTKKEYIITNTKEIIEYCKGNKDIINFINEEFYVGTQFKMILNVDALKDEASATLYLRTTMDEKYNILSAETIDIKKALKFLGYQNKEKFLEDLNRVRVNQEEEEFE